MKINGDAAGATEYSMEFTEALQALREAPGKAGAPVGTLACLHGRWIKLISSS